MLIYKKHPKYSTQENKMIQVKHLFKKKDKWTARKFYTLKEEADV
jgi:hypothetical protein